MISNLLYRDARELCEPFGKLATYFLLCYETNKKVMGRQMVESIVKACFRLRKSGEIF